MTMREWVSAVLGIEPRGDTPQIIAKNRLIVFSPSNVRIVSHYKSALLADRII
jgi:hypothetical protein